jgi:hypothetical protein
MLQHNGSINEARDKVLAAANTIEMDATKTIVVVMSK